MIAYYVKTRRARADADTGVIDAENDGASVASVVSSASAAKHPRGDASRVVCRPWTPPILCRCGSRVRRARAPHRQRRAHGEDAQVRRGHGREARRRTPPPPPSPRAQATPPAPAPPPPPRISQIRTVPASSSSAAKPPSRSPATSPRKPPPVASTLVSSPWTISSGADSTNAPRWPSSWWRRWSGRNHAGAAGARRATQPQAQSRRSRFPAQEAPIRRPRPRRHQPSPRSSDDDREGLQPGGTDARLGVALFGRRAGRRAVRRTTRAASRKPSNLVRVSLGAPRGRGGGCGRVHGRVERRLRRAARACSIPVRFADGQRG